MRRWSGRSRIRCTCAVSAGSGCGIGCGRVDDQEAGVRRLGAAVIKDICAQVIGEATRPGAGKRRFVVRAARINSRSSRPTFAIPPILGWPRTPRRCWREGKRVRGLAGPGAWVRDRSRQIAGRLRRLNKSVAARTATARIGATVDRRGRRGLGDLGAREARRLAALLRRRARGRGAQASGSTTAARALDHAGREGLAQIAQRLARRSKIGS